MSVHERTYCDPIKQCVKYARKFEGRIRKRKQERNWRRLADRQILGIDNLID